VHSQSSSAAAVQICFLLYLPLAYVMGMACSLGFGTLSARISSKHMVVLAGMWATVFTALTLQGLVSKVPQVLISAVFLCAFALQVATTLVTLREIKQRRRQCSERGFMALAINLHRSQSQLRLIFALFFLLFAIEIVNEVIRTTERGATTELWSVYLVATTVVNSWVLLLMRPREAL